MMQTKQTLAAMVTRYEAKYLASMNVAQREYWRLMLENAQELLDNLNLENEE